MSEFLAGEIEAAIGEELKELAGLGFSVVHGEYREESFGDFFVDLRRGDQQIRIVRDRRQYFLEGERVTLEKAGLWKAFDSKDEFFQTLAKHLEGTA